LALRYRVRVREDDFPNWGWFLERGYAKTSVGYFALVRYSSFKYVWDAPTRNMQNAAHKSQQDLASKKQKYKTADIKM